MGGKERETIYSSNMSAGNSGNRTESVRVMSPIGILGVSVSGRGVLRVCLPDEASSAAPAAETSLGPLLSQAVDEIQSYLEGQLQRFTIPLDLRGTPFQLEVWRALLRIPYGGIVTYGQVASLIGNPRASRAVGQAVGRNPLPLLVPCHRVVAAGSLGGFGGGLWLKRWLLGLERMGETPRQAELMKGYLQVLRGHPLGFFEDARGR